MVLCPNFLLALAVALQVKSIRRRKEVSGTEIVIDAATHL
jgi:hypothetical protein